MNRDDMLSTATQFYLESNRFNGISLSELSKRGAVPPEELFGVVEELISKGGISLNFGDRHPNAHIKAFPEESSEEQVRKLRKADPAQTCVYPTTAHLEKVVDPLEYEGRPYTLRLALGAAQFDFDVFDLSVLELYRNDPRYVYSHDDVSGWIALDDGLGDDVSPPDRDHIVLETFGFAYDRNLDRAVAVFLWYLSELTGEHQQYWQAKSLDGKYTLHPGYLDMTQGKWPERVPILMAFLEEQRVINKMAEAMGRAPFFRNVWEDSDRPREFSFLIRPTAKEFNAFVLLLDKMLSDNINVKFFGGDVPLESEIVRDDEKIEVARKGTIQLLSDWIGATIEVNDATVIDEIIGALREVRRLRQSPAHAVKEDVFDHAYVSRQRELIVKAYKAVRAIRLLFANHPRARRIVPSPPVRDGLIWSK